MYLGQSAPVKYRTWLKRRQARYKEYYRKKARSAAQSAIPPSKTGRSIAIDVSNNLSGFGLSPIYGGSNAPIAISSLRPSSEITQTPVQALPGRDYSDQINMLTMQIAQLRGQIAALPSIGSSQQRQSLGIQVTMLEQQLNALRAQQSTQQALYRPAVARAGIETMRLEPESEALKVLREVKVNIGTEEQPYYVSSRTADQLKLEGEQDRAIKNAANQTMLQVKQQELQRLVGDFVYQPPSTKPDYFAVSRALTSTIATDLFMRAADELSSTGDYATAEKYVFAGVRKALNGIADMQTMDALSRDISGYIQRYQTAPQYANLTGFVRKYYQPSLLPPVSDQLQYGTTSPITQYPPSSYTPLVVQTNPSTASPAPVVSTTSETPKWLLPVMVGAGALLVMMA